MEQSRPKNPRIKTPTRNGKEAGRGIATPETEDATQKKKQHDRGGRVNEHTAPYRTERTTRLNGDRLTNGTDTTASESTAKANETGQKHEQTE